MAQLFVLLLVLWPWGTLPIPHRMPDWYWRELGHFAVNAQLVEESEGEWRADDVRMQPKCGVPEPGWQRERRTSDARKQLAWVLVAEVASLAFDLRYFAILPESHG